MREVPAVIGEETIRQDVGRAVDELDTTEASRYAIARGVLPPTEDPAWMLCQRFEPDGSEGPLVWVLVTESEAAH
ncbi:hypothetical protein [Plantactinospora mayteni]|uniref:hypothetical protein n=1 Tax=Plantactinospora mayteni TaxID=566021 RepID=UPI0019403CFA|nr:hypothetical protein [Plantactinospora mayteni]